MQPYFYATIEEIQGVCLCDQLGHGCPVTLGEAWSELTSITDIIFFQSHFPVHCQFYSKTVNCIRDGSQIRHPMRKT